MKRIISIRVKSDDPLKREQFTRGSDRTVQTKIVNLINRNPSGDYEFLIDDKGNKYVASFGDLEGEVINIVDDNYIAEFTYDDGGNPLILTSQNEGALPQEHTLDQLKMVRKKSRGTDIGDKISDMNKQGANIQYIQNPIDTGIETMQDYERNNKKFVPNWNLKRLKPFKNYLVDQTTSHRSKSKNRKKK